jgi:hypothetical protein
MHALPLTLVLPATPATSAPQDAVTFHNRPFLDRPGATRLLTGVVVGGAGVTLSTIAVPGARADASTQQELDDAVAAYTDRPGRTNGNAILAAREQAGTTGERSLRSQVNLGLVVGGAAAMGIGWAIAALGADQLTEGDPAP